MLDREPSYRPEVPTPLPEFRWSLRWREVIEVVIAGFVGGIVVEVVGNPAPEAVGYGLAAASGTAAIIWLGANPNVTVYTKDDGDGK